MLGRFDCAEGPVFELPAKCLHVASTACDPDPIIWELYNRYARSVMHYGICY